MALGTLGAGASTLLSIKFVITNGENAEPKYGFIDDGKTIQRNWKVNGKLLRERRPTSDYPMHCRSKGIGVC